MPPGFSVNFMINKARHREHAAKASKLGIKSLPIEVLRKMSQVLNAKNFKSEQWFIGIMRTHIKFNMLFYRNHPILNRYYADFFIRKYSLIIEIDGSSHRDSYHYDKNRDHHLTESGFKVIRIKEYDDEGIKGLINFLENVIET